PAGALRIFTERGSMPVANRVALGFAIALACGTFVPAKADVMEELAPTGKLRVAIAVAPAPSALYAIKDEATGKYRGVTVELGSTIAKKLGVPVEFVPHLASGEIQNSADANRWDVTFMPVDANEKNSSTSAMPITCCKAPTLWRPARSPRKSRTSTNPACVSAVSRIPRLCDRAQGDLCHSAGCRRRRRRYKGG
ncbi:MAG: transporter substrate-binding domain-containing protein, partial [Pseudolabrys sp.]